MFHKLGHKDIVYSVDFSNDGTRFASGGADNVVVIWKNTGQGLLKFTHTTAVVKVKFSPTAIKLVSCAETDFGIWTPEQKQVTKEKITSRVLSIAWSSDGNFYALGTVTGMISIRNNDIEEVMRIERKAPIWNLLYIPSTPNAVSKSTNVKKLAETEILVVGCWQKVLSFYK